MFKSIIPGRVKEANLIKYMRVFIVLFGAFITAGALLFTILPGTVIGFSMLISGSISAPVTMIFFLGIYNPSTNPSGIIVGTITSQVVLGLKLIGMFWYPAPSEISDLTLRNSTMCNDQFSCSRIDKRNKDYPTG